MRIPAFMLLLLLAQIGWKGGQKFPLPPPVAEATVDSLAENYYEAKLACYPALATLKGVPGHDGKLSTYSQKSIFGLLGRIRNVGQRLSTFDEDSLSMDKWIEYKALLADMAAQRFLLEDLELWRSRPTLYVDACADGIAFLYLSHGRRISDIDLAPRLRMIPLVVTHARRNLTNPGELHCRVASKRVEAVIGMLEDLPAQPFPPAIDPGLLQESIDALEGFKAFLDSLSLSADTDFALGYDDFMILLDARNMVSDMPEDMRSHARRVLDAVNAELGELPPDTSAGEPDRAGRMSRQDLEAEMESAWDFIIRTGTVSLPVEPPGGSSPGVTFLGLPDFAGRLYGDMLYLEPGPDPEPGYLTPLYVASEVAEPGATLSGLVSSEAIPGRHMQALVAAMSASPVCRMHEDIFASNGWALYSQELMAREGFGGEAGIRAALERKRFYAAGTIAAVNLLLGESSLEQAADFMVKATGVSEAYARELAVQYAMEPEHPISYIIGERQILQIRDEVSRILGDGFDLTAFHDGLLTCGRLPLYLLRNSAVSGSVGRR